jgi:hypothetical protein
MIGSLISYDVQESSHIRIQQRATDEERCVIEEQSQLNHVCPGVGRTVKSEVIVLRQDDPVRGRK